MGADAAEPGDEAGLLDGLLNAIRRLDDRLPQGVEPWLLGHPHPAPDVRLARLEAEVDAVPVGADVHPVTPAPLAVSSHEKVAPRWVL